MKIVNLIGLVLVSIGALLAIFSAPGPSYQRNGNIGLGDPNKSGPEFRSHRIRIYFFQKYGLPASFSMIAVGSALQVYAAWCDL